MSIDEGFLEAFLALHSDLPREGPGGEAETRRALDLAAPPPAARIGDLGCGPGAATTVLLQALPQATVFACDLHPPYVAEARRRAEALGLADRLDAQVADMAAPPLAPASLDLIWSEAAIYNLGVEAALAAWRPLLAPGGRVVFSEAVRLKTPMSPRAETLWSAEYPTMTDPAGVSAQIAAAGFEERRRFVLPPECWDGYYGPLEARADALDAELGATEPGAAALAETREEIAVWRACRGEYGYAVFIAEPA
ncbi:MAG: methyltransferase domain-containing protein [Pseudomonadota bacterium]